MKIQMQILYMSLILIPFCSFAHTTIKESDKLNFEDKLYSQEIVRLLDKDADIAKRALSTRLTNFYFFATLRRNNVT
jgi:hypothetical protein